MHEPFAAGAGQPGPNGAVHDEAAGDVFQFLGHVLTDPAQAPTTVGTGIGTGAGHYPASQPAAVRSDRTLTEGAKSFVIKRITGATEKIYT